MNQPLNTRFAEAAQAGDFYHVITLARKNGLVSKLAKATHIGRRTLRGMQGGRITPSKNQQAKICAFALTVNG